MKILYITTVPETFFFFFAPVLERIRQEKGEVVLASSGGTWITGADVENKYGVPVRVLSFSRSLFSLRDLAGFFGLVRLIAREKPDVLHASTPKAAFFAMLAGRICRVPLRIYSARGLIAYGKPALLRALLHRVEKLACASAHRVIVNSPSNLGYFLDNRLCRASKIGMLGNGSGQGVDAQGKFNPEAVPEPAIRELKAKHNIPGSAVVFGFVGRLVRDKGVVELAEAWKRFNRACPDSILLIIGPEKEPRDALPAATLRYLATEKSVRLAGAVRDPAPYYALMDVLVLPSRREGFPNVVLEAAAMSRPVITTGAPGCVDSIVDGVTGLRYPVQDVDMLVERMEKLYGDPELRKKMGSAGRAHVLKYYRPQFIIEDLLHLYKEKTFRNHLGKGLQENTLPPSFFKRGGHDRDV